MGALHFITKDFGLIPARGQKAIFFKAGFVHDVPDEIAEHWFFQRHCDDSKVGLVREARSFKAKQKVVEALEKAAEPPAPSPVKHVPIGQTMADRANMQSPPRRESSVHDVHTAPMVKPMIPPHKPTLVKK